jgi:hypothetical protein
MKHGLNTDFFNAKAQSRQVAKRLMEIGQQRTRGGDKWLKFARWEYV